ALEVVEDRRVGGRRVGVGVLLAEVPAGLHGPERPGAADERRQPREAFRVALAGVVTPGVDRLEVAALGGGGGELLPRRGPLAGGPGRGPAIRRSGRGGSRRGG